MAQTYVPTNEQWADLVSRIKAVQVVDQYGWNASQAISRAKATSLLYQQEDNAKGQLSTVRIKTPGNPNFSFLNRWGAIVGTQNTLTVNDGAQFNWSLVYGYMNQITAANKDGASVLIYGASNKTNSSSAMIFGSGNTYDGGNVYISIGNNNTSYAKKEDGTYDFNYTGTVDAEGAAMVIGYGNFVYESEGIMIGHQTMNYTKDDIMIGQRCFMGARFNSNNTNDNFTKRFDPTNTHNNSICIGRNATGYGYKNVCIGLDTFCGGSSTSLINGSVEVQGSVAIGAGSIALRDQEFAIGGKYWDGTARKGVEFTRVLSGVSEAQLDTDAVNKKQLVEYVAANAPEPEAFTDAEWAAMWA